ncbi:MAG: phosphate ABC transporter permease subunit PstC [Fervidicoccaceae archaeon]
MRLGRPLGDLVFFYCLAAPAAAMVLAFALLFYAHIDLSREALELQGLKTFAGARWRPSLEPPPKSEYGLLPAIVGTLTSAGIALLIALPVSVLLAVFLVEIAPRSLSHLLGLIIDALAGLPSVVYGLWGLYFLGPFLRKNLMEPLHELLGFLPFFSCKPLSGASVLTAGILLSIMITPFASALVYEAYRSVPSVYIEAAYSLGMTRYEQAMTRLSMIRGAVVSAALLGLGRAMSETAAVTMVVGNAYVLSPCVFSPAYTITSLIANQFAESRGYPLMLSSLFAGSLLLLCVGLIVNAAGLRALRSVRL